MPLSISKFTSVQGNELALVKNAQGEAIDVASRPTFDGREVSLVAPENGRPSENAEIKRAFILTLVNTFGMEITTKAVYERASRLWVDNSLPLGSEQVQDTIGAAKRIYNENSHLRNARDMELFISTLSIQEQNEMFERMHLHEFFDTVCRATGREESAYPFIIEYDMQDSTFIDLFRAQVKSHPDFKDKPLVSFEKQDFSAFHEAGRVAMEAFCQLKEAVANETIAVTEAANGIRITFTFASEQI